MEYIEEEFQKRGPRGPVPSWPPVWLTRWQAEMLPSATTSSSAEPLDHHEPTPDVTSVDASPAATAHLIPDELENLLQTIEADVVRRQVTAELLRAARQLLTDCRDAAQVGEVASALASARHLEHSIPALLDERGFR